MPLLLVLGPHLHAKGLEPALWLSCPGRGTVQPGGSPAGPDLASPPPSLCPWGSSPCQVCAGPSWPSGACGELCPVTSDLLWLLQVQVQLYPLPGTKQGSVHAELHGPEVVAPGPASGTPI